MAFVPALIIVDVQEDFCPPNGSLAVPHGRTILPMINSLLTLPFSLKLATKDFHPPSHISFASNHPAPNNIPFTSEITINNPLNPAETQTTRLWPNHCVQGTPGAELVPELDVDKIDRVVEKGMDERVEMYSAFKDPFREPCVCSSGLGEVLREKGVTDVFVVGLAADYCVRYTAIDAAKEGFRTRVIGEATKAVDEGNMGEVMKEYSEVGVEVVEKDDESLKRVEALV